MPRLECPKWLKNPRRDFDNNLEDDYEEINNLDEEEVNQNVPNKF